MEGFDILYWHWIVLGLLLIGLEIVLPTFMTLWFGIGAIFTGIMLLMFPDLPLAWQLLIWLMDSCVLVFLWFRFVQPQIKDRTKAGMGRESLIGETGIVIRAPQDGRRGMLRFPTPIMGDDEWEIICETDLAEGDRVMVVELSGNSLVVNKK